MLTSICVHNKKTPAVRFINGHSYLAFAVNSRDDWYSDVSFLLESEGLKDFHAELVAAAEALGEYIKEHQEDEL